MPDTERVIAFSQLAVKGLKPVRYQVMLRANEMSIIGIIFE
jgi:hypothetical protein